MIARNCGQADCVRFPSFNESSDGSEGKWSLEEEYRRLLKLVAWDLPRSIRQRVDPDDVVQEAMLEAVRRGQFAAATAGTSHSIRLTRICRDALVRNVRRHLGATNRSVRRECDSAEELAKTVAARSDAADKQVANGEQLERIRAVLASLPQEDREALGLLCEENSLEYECATQAAMTDAERKRRQRLRLRLRKLLRLQHDACDRA